MRVIGAGLGRTGTTSLKLALQILLDGPCYHMSDVFERPSDIPFWTDAALNTPVQWQTFFSAHAAAVDWPAAAFYPELMQAMPDSLVLLSLRDQESWWESAQSTIFPKMLASEGDWRRMMEGIMRNRFTWELDNKDAALAAYTAHADQVRRSVSRERLIEWWVGDGWEPLCAALDLPIPDVPFPHANTKKEFLRRSS